MQIYSKIDFPDLGFFPESFLRNPDLMQRSRIPGIRSSRTDPPATLYGFGQFLKQNQQINLIADRFDFALTPSATYVRISTSKGIDAVGDIVSCQLIEQCITGNVTEQYDRIRGVLERSETRLGRQPVAVAAVRGCRPWVVAAPRAAWRACRPRAGCR